MTVSYVSFEKTVTFPSKEVINISSWTEDFRKKIQTIAENSHRNDPFVQNIDPEAATDSDEDAYEVVPVIKSADVWDTRRDTLLKRFITALQSYNLSQSTEDKNSVIELCSKLELYDHLIDASYLVEQDKKHLSEQKMLSDQKKLQEEELKKTPVESSEESARVLQRLIYIDEDEDDQDDQNEEAESKPKIFESGILLSEAYTHLYTSIKDATNLLLQREKSSDFTIMVVTKTKPVNGTEIKESINSEWFPDEEDPEDKNEEDHVLSEEYIDTSSESTREKNIETAKLLTQTLEHATLVRNNPGNEAHIHSLQQDAIKLRSAEKNKDICRKVLGGVLVLLGIAVIVGGILLAVHTGTLSAWVGSKLGMKLIATGIAVASASIGVPMVIKGRHLFKFKPCLSQEADAKEEVARYACKLATESSQFIPKKK